MKHTFSTYCARLITFVFLAVPFLVSAAGIPNPVGADSLTGLITLVIQKAILPIGTTIVVFFLIYSGFLFVTAQGNDEKITKAKTAFLWTVVGAGVLFGATVFATLICETVKDLGVPVQCS